MSKYIIDLRPDCKVVQQICASNENVNLGARSAGLLDELTEDYVKENFKDLLEGEYQQGFEEGKKATYELVADASNAEYQKGFEDGKAVHERGCEGCNYADSLQGSSPCFNCSNYYQNNWTAKDDKPIIGEVVERYLNGKRDGVGMFLGEDGDYWNCLFWTGAIFGTFAYPSNQFKRTGTVCDITKILEAMKND